MSSRIREKRLQVLANVGLIALAAATAGVVASATLSGGSTPPPVSDKVAEYYSNPPQPTTEKALLPQTPRPTVTEATELLNDPAREWSLMVFGDSTGNDTDEFVFLLAERMSDHYNRPVIMHRWVDAGYVAPLTIGAGGNAPIHIWNGSVPGQTATYATKNLEKMAPEGVDVDLVMVNYGHNYKGTWSAEQATLELAQALDDRLGAKAMLYMLQNPQNPETEDSAAVVSMLRKLTTDSGYETADVYSAFKATGDIGPLMVDNLHPNPAGGKVWAEAVAAKLIR